jgi:hypothetical protein
MKKRLSCKVMAPRGGASKMQARALGGDIGRAIGDWIQSSLGLRRGGKARKLKK